MSSLDEMLDTRPCGIGETPERPGPGVHRGLAVARSIARVEPLAPLPAERVVQLIGPALQRYLMQPLTPSR